jgi:hypothetical protein
MVGCEKPMILRQVARTNKVGRAGRPDAGRVAVADAPADAILE